MKDLLKNKNVVITGSSSGIGEAVAKLLVAKGAKLTLIARRSHELLRVQKEIQNLYGERVDIIAVDISLKESSVKILETFQKNNTTIDIIVHNAGVTAHGSFENTHIEVLEKVMQINFFSIAMLTKTLLPFLKPSYELHKKASKKLIALVSTPSGLHGIPLRYPYSASKAAAQSLMECISVECNEYNISTCIFYPGYTRTNLRTSGFDEKGEVLNEKQERDAIDVHVVAMKIVKGLEKCMNRRNTKKLSTFLMEKNGYLISYLKFFAPNFLRNQLYKKYKKENQER